MTPRVGVLAPQHGAAAAAALEARIADEIAAPRAATAAELEAMAGAALAMRSPAIKRALAAAEAARPRIKIVDVVDEHGRSLRDVPAGIKFKMEYDDATSRLFMIPDRGNRAQRRLVAAQGRRP